MAEQSHPFNAFIRYLSAKKSVDDRALNSQVWRAMVQSLPQKPLSVLEIGAGIGTMVERLLQRQVFDQDVRYTAIDAQGANILEAGRRLHSLPSNFSLDLKTVDLFDFAAKMRGMDKWDLLIAHAFLDLVDLSETLPLIFNLLNPGGLFYFTLNFDGETIFQPTIDPTLDQKITALYHGTMNERVSSGRPAGHSQTGRRLFEALTTAGGQITAAGSSDWVVFAGPSGYIQDEAYFLHFILQTVHTALSEHPHLDQALFDNWIAQRHAQVKTGELVYIAHQLDFFGMVDS